MAFMRILCIILILFGYDNFFIIQNDKFQIWPIWNSYLDCALRNLDWNDICTMNYFDIIVW